MSKSLQDICREARDRQGMTNQDVADNSNVPLSSVQNFFASTSKTPTVNTPATYAGPVVFRWTSILASRRMFCRKSK